jgi:hypothetical protein
MKGVLKACAIAIAVGISVHAIGAEPATPQGRRSLPVNAAALPDWSGEWEMVGLTPHDGGLYVESAEQIAVRWQQPQFTDDLMQRAFRAKLTQALTDAFHSGVTAGFACTFGFPMLMLEAPATFEVLATARQTSLIFSTREVRNIYTDGRAHTPNDEIWPTYWGDSVGHWEGQTLVIDTIAATSAFLPASVKKASNAAAAIGLSGGSNGAPPQLIAAFSPQAHYSERIRKVASGELEVKLTVDDPIALSSPWRLVRHFRKIPRLTRMIFQDCEGDTRHEIVNGQVTLKLSR